MYMFEHTTSIFGDEARLSGLDDEHRCLDGTIVAVHQRRLALGAQGSVPVCDQLVLAGPPTAQPADQTKHLQALRFSHSENEYIS